MLQEYAEEETGQLAYIMLLELVAYICDSDSFGTNLPKVAKAAARNDKVDFNTTLCDILEYFIGFHGNLKHLLNVNELYEEFGAGIGEDIHHDILSRLTNSISEKFLVNDWPTDNNRVNISVDVKKQLMADLKNCQENHNSTVLELLKRVREEYNKLPFR